jgi:hypothetical protein
VALLTTSFKALSHSMGARGAAIAVGVGTLALAAVSLLSLGETFGKDLDFVE